jgi:hypothetical protein
MSLSTHGTPMNMIGKVKHAPSKYVGDGTKYREKYESRRLEEQTAHFN